MCVAPLCSGLSLCSFVEAIHEDKKRHVVAVHYDEMVRRKWADKAYHAGRHGDFDLEAAMRELDKNVYEMALAMCVDAAHPPAQGATAVVSRPFKGKGKGKAGGRSQFMGVCHAGYNDEEFV